VVFAAVEPSDGFFGEPDAIEARAQRAKNSLARPRFAALLDVMDKRFLAFAFS
jgi:hypothetical protein